MKWNNITNLGGGYWLIKHYRKELGNDRVAMYFTKTGPSSLAKYPWSTIWSKNRKNACRFFGTLVVKEILEYLGTDYRADEITILTEYHSV